SMMDKFENFLVGHGLRLTNQRQLIAQTFFDEKGHISAEDLYRIVQKRAPAIGFTTVYRTLKLLTEAGIASGKNFGKASALFEATALAPHHDHLVCIRCGKIIEFVNEHIEQLQKSVAERHDFTMTDHNLEIYGICGECRKEEKNMT
ncbi:MAG: Fur family transcriptional regulator, partial [Thermodesulfobacteriota bacterium]